ncbi:hypothetical protein Cgig2_028153 [Carnegiea gigantea]|uniref:Uncharacterized protein n=1 Tax=Carnegiea gigantea TaxID=171969 RepID=A0A9Q1JZQ6_9CARY|nr:hypothetical protein Cgig2_028153 [Carnegiea gigantea]
MKRSSLGSMKGVRQLTRQTIRRLLMKKAKRIPNPWHEPITLRQPLTNHVQNVMTVEDVYAALELPTGPLEVHVASTNEPIKEYTKLLKQWRTGRNLSRIGTAKVGKMVTKSKTGGPWRRIQKRLCVARNFDMYYQKLSLDERNANTDDLQQQYIGQLMYLNNEMKLKRSSLESKEGRREMQKSMVSNSNTLDN